MMNDSLIHSSANQQIKCVVWDLDHTLWDGVLLENDRLALRAGVRTITTELDRRGILQSVASKNEHEPALAQLAAFGLSDYFLYPQINWNAKSASIEAIARALNIGIDTVAFVDDQAVEREEVKFSLPQVLCIDAAHLDQLLAIPAMTPRFVTADASQRRQLYLNDLVRQQVEADFVGPKEGFLASLDMVFTISRASEDDLQRAEELTVRTHQLNTTGYTYSYDELKGFCHSDRHLLLISGLDDKFGSYGKIGVTLVECGDSVWIIKLLLMSCRVMSRGLGAVMINYLREEARRHGVRLQAELLPNDRNRMTYMTFKFAHFREAAKIGDLILLESNLDQAHHVPPYLAIRVV